MGIFLSLSGVIDRSPQEVEASVKKYAESVKGGFERANVADDDPNLAVLGRHASNVTLIYPNEFEELEAASAFLSQDLGTPVFALHIHDEDLWLFQLFQNGERVTGFNPLPDYWDEDIPETEFQYWQGDAHVVSGLVPGVTPESIEKYFIRWNWEDEGEVKAYPGDEFGYGDCWQLVDFMEKVGLQYPIDAEGNIQGRKYKLWTSSLPLEG
jgi:hypothetical protein